MGRSYDLWSELTFLIKTTLASAWLFRALKIDRIGPSLNLDNPEILDSRERQQP